MEDYQSVAILGRQPALGLAELESLYGPDNLSPIAGGALLKLPTEDIAFKRLGGTIKLAKLLFVLPTTNWPEIERYLLKTIPQHLVHVPEGKFTLGLSSYNGAASAQTLTKTAMKIKKSAGRSMRIVPNKTPELGSAQVLHNKLTSRGAWELLLIRDGQRTLLAQTIFVQDIEAYAARDQARPKRDARVGMLPPKLAQTIINLAKPTAGSTVLDPFCGSGVILQEASLMGFSVYGTDLDERMVEYSRQNLEWLIDRVGHELNFDLAVGDATSFGWNQSISCIASEVYLGHPFTAPPDRNQLREVIGDVNTILKKFLKNAHTQMEPSTRLCLAVPTWRSQDAFVHLPLLDQLTDLGYNRLSFVHAKADDLIYFREGQIVGRELVVLTKE